jgi:hypothetical protein
VKIVRTVAVEILRDGEAHNQLLSPLTRYLGLCGNHPAAPIQVPFEHEQLRHRLRDLDYRRDDEGRHFQLTDLARALGRLLRAMPGLVSELTATAGEQSVTHLRLILSAYELSLLPLELASAPEGLPGAGRSLALLGDLPLCITREVRRVGIAQCRWPERPRILFAAAAPPGVGPIPLDAHLLALRQVIDPWVAFADRPRPSPPADKGLRTHRDDYLTVLPQATARAVEEACARDDFTHVHILAHGIELLGTGQGSYGLALHGEGGRGRQDVNGDDLAKMLGGGRAQRPTVVTLAICDSGRVGPVERAGGGASIAHALHEEGIPLVVASQFPLSHAASVLMTQVLYKGLLQGDDPRLVLYDLRDRLRSRVLGTHDWASLVAYASFPENLEEQLADVRYVQARAAVEAALQLNDSVNKAIEEPGPDSPPRTDAQRESDFRQARQRMTEAERRQNELLADEMHGRQPERLARMHGLLASTKKRFAESFFRENQLYPQGDARAKPNEDEPKKYLTEARNSYWDAFQVDRSSSWAVVQYLAIEAVLEGVKGLVAMQSQWVAARVLAESDLSLKEEHPHKEQRKAMAYGSLLELCLLGQPLPPEGRGTRTNDEAKVEAERLATALKRLEHSDSIELYSTRRQIQRYYRWFSTYQPELKPLDDLAKHIVGLLPLSRRFVR